MSSIWIDLTDIEQWSGNHGGIQRVVYGIAKNYYIDQSDFGQTLRFFAYNSHTKSFQETSFEPIFELVENSTSGQTVNNVSQRARIKNVLVHYTPASLRKNEHLRRAVIKNSHRALRVLHKTRSTMSGLRAKVKQPTKSTTQPVQFMAEDTVLILGKPWDNLEIQSLLTKQKQETHFFLVQIVYDLIISLYPQLHHPTLFVPYTQHIFEAVAASDLLLPISESSAKDLRRFCKQLNLPVPDVHVIRLGDNVVGEHQLRQAEKPDSRIQDTFLLCVGTIEIRKNHMLLYYTYKLAAERGITLPQLFIVGSRGWLSGDFQYLVEHDPFIKDKIILLEQLSDTSLAWMYQNCLFTVYPSMYEGWGLPVAESLSYGKMCIASNTSSIPEIAGELIDYFSPFDAEELLKKLMTYLDEKKRTSKEEQIKLSYKTTDWAETYGSICKLIKN